MTRALVVVGVLLAAIVAWYLTRNELSLDRVVESERQLRTLIRVSPWRSFAIGFWLYVAVSVFPGTSGKSVVAGWLFGLWPALVMVLGALTVAGLIGFSGARWLLRDVLRDSFGPRLTRFDQALNQEGVFYLLTLRLLHVPFTFVNYMSGVSTLRVHTFMWTTLVGLAPTTLVLVSLGSGLPSLKELLEDGVMSVVDPLVLAALTGMALIPWLVRWTIRKRRSDRVVSVDVVPAATQGRSR